MRKSSVPFRRIAALAAIYVVVLQALLLPLAVAAGAPSADSLCITAGTEVPAPASHDAGCACAAGCGSQCCVQGVLGDATGAAAIALTRFHVLSPAIMPEPAVILAARGPQNPRAPPAA